MEEHEKHDFYLKINRISQADYDEAVAEIEEAKEAVEFFRDAVALADSINMDIADADDICRWQEEVEPKVRARIDWS